MSDPVIIILGLAGIAVLAALYAWAMYASRHSARYPVRAIGIIALLAGLYITGVAELLLTGIRALVDWFRTTLVDEQVISPEDVGLIQVIDKPEEVVEAIFKHYERIGFAPLPAEREKLLNL